PDHVAETVDAVIVSDLLAHPDFTECGRAAPDNVAVLFPGGRLARVVDVAGRLRKKYLATIRKPVTVMLLLSLAQRVLAGDNAEFACVEDDFTGSKVARGEDAKPVDRGRFNDDVAKVAFHYE